MLVTSKEARVLYDKDCHVAVFRSEFGQTMDRERARSVFVYPRKSAPGFNYCIWKFGVAEIGTMAIEGGGTVEGSLRDAALEAVQALLFHCGASTTSPPEAS